VTRTPVLVVAGLLGALVLAGCGSSKGGDGYGFGFSPPPNAGGASASAAAPASPGEQSVPATQLTDTLIAATEPKVGAVVTDQYGFVLYRYEKDSTNPPRSNCLGKCAQAWPPALTDGNPTLKGVPIDKVGVIMRDDGTHQLTLGDWPLYRYAGDLKPGQWRGQNVSGTWFVVTKDGAKNTTLPVPPAAPPAAPPPARPPAAPPATSPPPGGY
jgi:predicted lipoprotein with Yx(FWY)xxD motif